MTMLPRYADGNVRVYMRTTSHDLLVQDNAPHLSPTQTQSASLHTSYDKF